MVNGFRQNVFDSGFLAGVCAEGGGARPILVENTFTGGDPTSQVYHPLSDSVSKSLYSKQLGEKSA